MGHATRFLRGARNHDSMAKTRVAINGFGRIGRMAFKVALEKQDELEVVALNDLADAATLAHLFKRDTVHGIYPGEVTSKDGEMTVDGTTYPVLNEKDPSQLPWKKLDVDVVLECTGVFRTKEQMQMHTDAGAKLVLLSAPAKSEGIETVVKGVNDADFDASNVHVSSASCTTNCIAPVIAVLEREFGVEKAMLTTIHGYTADQALVDGPHKDLRRGRSAAVNIVPTTTGAAIATGEVIPAVGDTFDGIAIRVPVPNGSLSDITAVLKKDVTVEEVNDALKKASEEEHFKGVLTCTDEPIVSSDIVGRSESSIVDMPLTKVIGGNLVKVVAWYDNEIGYSYRLVEQAVSAGKLVAG